MKFHLVDRIESIEPGKRIVTVKALSLAEEYLADHFPTFPVLPGVMMVETMVQAARTMLTWRGDGRLVLGEARALRFGQMVRPGETLEVQVTLSKELEDGGYLCRGTGRVRRPDADHPKPQADGAQTETTVSGRFTMRPIQRD